MTNRPDIRRTHLSYFKGKEPIFTESNNFTLTRLVWFFVDDISYLEHFVYSKDGAQVALP